jgi:hypothetical protein
VCVCVCAVWLRSGSWYSPGNWLAYRVYRLACLVVFSVLASLYLWRIAVLSVIKCKRHGVCTSLAFFDGQLLVLCVGFFACVLQLLQSTDPLGLEHIFSLNATHSLHTLPAVFAVIAGSLVVRSLFLLRTLREKYSVFYLSVTLFCADSRVCAHSRHIHTLSFLASCPSYS